MNQLKRKQVKRTPGQTASLSLLDNESSSSLSKKAPLNSHHKTLIVIPSYNEEFSIAKVLEGIKKQAPQIQVLVIDDGSMDKTAQLAQENGAKIISLPYNSGYGVPCKLGISTHASITIL